MTLHPAGGAPTIRHRRFHTAAKLVIRQKQQVKTPPPVLTSPVLFVWMAVELVGGWGWGGGLIKALAAQLHG